MVETPIEEVTELDLIYEANDRIDAVIELLIEKNIFSEHEFNKKLDEIYEANDVDQE